MSTEPTTSQASTFQLKCQGVIGAAVAVVFAARLVMPPPAIPVGGSSESRGRWVIGLVILILQAGIAAVGCVVVRQTIAAVGDGARARIQADALQIASIAAFGIAFIVAPSRYGAQAGFIMNAAGLVIVGIGACIAHESLTPSAVRRRLEREADHLIASSG